MGRWLRGRRGVSLLGVLDAWQPLSPLSVTLAPLVSDASGQAVKIALDRIASLGFRQVQFAATMPGLRPRELDRAARRDLLASLRRRELQFSGIDAWIPPEHFDDPERSDRAVDAVRQVIQLAADLGRVPVSLTLRGAGEVAAAIVAHAQLHGIAIADHSVPLTAGTGAGIGIDPVACLSEALDPAGLVHEAADHLVSARLADLLRSGMRGPPGLAHERRLDLIAYRIALSVNNYQRAVVIDARQWSNPWQGVQQSMNAWNVESNP